MVRRDWWDDEAAPDRIFQDRLLHALCEHLKSTASGLSWWVYRTVSKKCAVKVHGGGVVQIYTTQRWSID